MAVRQDGYLAPVLLPFLFWLLVTVSAAPSSSLPRRTDAPTATQTKREVKASELDAIFKDDIIPAKRKRSQEGIMFGNQQNKPAGMIDGGLSGLVHQKQASDSEEDNPRTDADKNAILVEKQNLTNTVPEDINETSEDSEANHVLLREPSLATDVLLNQPLSHHSSAEDDSDANGGGSIPPGLTQQIAADLEDRLVDLPTDSQRGVLNPRGDANDDSSVLKYNDRSSYLLPAWDAGYSSQSNEPLLYSNDVFRRRRRRNIHHLNERRFRKRSTRTPIEELISFKRRLRMKRDSNEDQNMLTLLEILAAAELAKEKQQEREIPVEVAMLLESILSQNENGYNDETLNAGDAYPYPYPTIPDEPPVQSLDNRITSPPEIEYPNYPVFLPPIEYRARRGGSWFQPTDYRAIGLPGQRKRGLTVGRQRPESPSEWGRFEEKRRKLLSTMVDDNFDDDNNIYDGDSISAGLQAQPNLPLNYFAGRSGANRDEDDQKLYTLGELLSGNDDDDDGEEGDGRTGFSAPSNGVDDVSPVPLFRRVL